MMEASRDEHGSRASRGSPRRAKLQAELERGAAPERKAHSGSSSGAAPLPRGDVSRRYSVDEKKAMIAV